MTTGIILIVATLVLGGVIASVGDRIGTKVGKARLSLFNLRPRKTAVLITLLTGSLISGSTLAILFAASDELRTGVFKLEKIQKNLKNARKEIDRTKIQKGEVESELARAKGEQLVAQQRLDATNQSLQVALTKLSEAAAKQSRTQAQLNQTQGQLSQTQSELNQTQNQLKTVSAQVTALGVERQTLVEQRDRLQAERQKLIQERQQLLAERETLIAQQEQEKAKLNLEIEKSYAERQQLLAQKEQVKAKLEAEIEKSQAESQQLLSQKEQETAQLEAEIEKSQAERERLLAQREQEEAQLKSEIDRYQVERQALIEQQEQVKTRLNQLQVQIDQRDRDLAGRDRVIALRENTLKQLETQQKELETKQVYLQRILEDYYQDYQALREGKLVLFRNQVLASGVVRIVEPSAARQAVDRLLLTANRVAIESTRPGDKTFNQQVIKITQTEVEQLVARINDGQDYVVRIISSGNYVRGESAVQVFVDVAANRLVFQAGEVMATTSAEPQKMSEEQLLKRIEQLIAASQFRARRAGIVAEKIQIGDGRIETLMRFVDRLRQSDESIDVQAITVDLTYTSGPVKMDLVAIQKGQVIFRTSSTS